MEDQLLSILYGAVLGTAYGIVGFTTNRDGDEPFKPFKLSRTVVVWSSAGAFVSLAGFSPNDPSVVGEYTAITSGLGYTVDQAYAFLKRRSLIPEGVEESVDEDDSESGEFAQPDDVDMEELDETAAVMKSALEYVEENDISLSNYNKFVSDISNEFDRETAEEAWEALKFEGVIGPAEESDG